MSTKTVHDNQRGQSQTCDTAWNVNSIRFSVVAALVSQFSLIPELKGVPEQYSDCILRLSSTVLSRLSPSERREPSHHREVRCRGVNEGSVASQSRLLYSQQARRGGVVNVDAARALTAVTYELASAPSVREAALTAIRTATNNPSDSGAQRTSSMVATLTLGAKSVHATSIGESPACRRSSKSQSGLITASRVLNPSVNASRRRMTAPATRHSARPSWHSPGQGSCSPAANAGV